MLRATIIKRLRFVQYPISVCILYFNYILPLAATLASLGNEALDTHMYARAAGAAEGYDIID
ncbi:MAG: hypothetical protein JEY71_11490 [Sphaerochaeta sp.]|nr:hypothetical protein [Sphaerochaeta sp.]